MSEYNLNWDHLIGYEVEFENLQKLAQEKKLPPVILFHGREGIGKSLFVSKLCSLLSCDNSSACGYCAACERHINNKNPSFLFVDASSQKVSNQDISKIQDHLLTYSAAGSSQRIFFLKDAEHLSQQNVNKLLKIFEELPSHCHIFLSTSRRFSLLPTLRSRCVEFLLLPPSLEKSVAFLEQKIKDNPYDFEQKPEVHELKQLLEISRGSLGLTLRWLKQKNSSPKLAKCFENLIFANDYIKNHLTIDRLKRDQSSTLEEFLQAQELALNKILKQELKNKSDQGTYEVLAQKRKDLRKLKNIILNQKIRLNKAFVLESLILV